MKDLKNYKAYSLLHNIRRGLDLFSKWIRKVEGRIEGNTYATYLRYLNTIILWSIQYDYDHHLHVDQSAALRII